MTTWMIITKPGEAGALVEMLGADAKQAKALVIGSRELADEAAHVAASVQWIDAQNAPADAFASAAAELVCADEAPVLVGFATPAARAVAGIVAAKTGASVVSNVTSASGESGTVKAEHTVIDDRVIESLDVPTPACLLAATLSFQPVDVDASAAAAPTQQVEAAPSAAITCTQVTDIPVSGVETAEYVIGIGRGVSKPEQFEQAKHLAATLGAEMSGSMPGVRDFGYFDKDASYIGLSGVRLNSKLYIALGISGSTPHLPGLLNAGTVVCVNNDENAAMFNHSTYGIVGDVTEVVPALVEALA